MKVRFTVRTGDARKGEVREVPDHIGEAYVRLGYAVRLDAPKPVETATAPTVEVEKRSTDFAGQAPTPAPVPRPARRGRPPRR